MVQVHFALDLEGFRLWSYPNSTWQPTWHGVDNVSWSIGYCVRSIKKTWTKRITGGCSKQLDCHWFLETLYCNGGGFQTTYYFGQPIKYAMVPQLDPFSLYTQLGGPLIAKLEIYLPRIWPFDYFQGSLVMVIALDMCI